MNNKIKQIKGSEYYVNSNGEVTKNGKSIKIGKRGYYYLKIGDKTITVKPEILILNYFRLDTQSVTDNHAIINGEEYLKCHLGFYISRTGEAYYQNAYDFWVPVKRHGDMYTLRRKTSTLPHILANTFIEKPSDDHVLEFLDGDKNNLAIGNMTWTRPAEIKGKVCHCCNQYRLREEFHSNKNRADKMQTRCRPCQNHVMREYQRDNSEDNRNRAKKFGKENPGYGAIFTNRARAKKFGGYCTMNDVDDKLELFRKANKIQNETGERMSVDHIFPISKGGPDVVENMAILPFEKNVYEKNNSLKWKSDDYTHWSDLPTDVLNLVPADKLEQAYATLSA